MAVIVARGVTASTVASALKPKVLPESNEKRIGRFFRAVKLEGEGLARLMLALLPIKEGWVLTLDRTTWELGSVCINILMLGVAYKGLAFPLLWVLLDKKGNSDTAERLALIDKMLTFIEAENTEAVVATREFTGNNWFKGLKSANSSLSCAYATTPALARKVERARLGGAITTSTPKRFTSAPSAAAASTYTSTLR